MLFYYMRYFLLLLTILLFWGCATRSEVKRFQVQIDYIEASNARMQKDLGRLDSLVIEQQKLIRALKAEQGVSLMQLARDISVIANLLDDSGLRVSQLNERLESLRRDIIHQPQPHDHDSIDNSDDSLSLDSPKFMLDEIFEAAFIDQRRGNFEAAIDGYRFFLEELAEQESALADEAQYGIAECLFSLERYNDANIEYQKLIDNYPQSGLVPSALFKKGIVYQRTGKNDLAKIVFNRIVINHSNTPEAKLAQERLEHLE